MWESRWDILVLYEYIDIVKNMCIILQYSIQCDVIRMAASETILRGNDSELPYHTYIIKMSSNTYMRNLLSN